jgi:LPS sulfotransferase NodH
MHAAAAQALEAPCRRFLGKPVPQDDSSKGVRFVIVAAERTGTNLLIGLLNDYEGFFAGAELFNPVNISKDIVPWRGVDESDLPALLEQRRSDPVGFWNALCERSESRGHRAVGFKLLYGHALSQKELLERLQSDRAIRIIHVTRRNLLRRFVSERQALASGKWAQGVSSESAPPAAVEIGLNDLASSFATVSEREQTFERIFAGHPVLHVVYEDLARRPGRVAERAARFLGLSDARVEPSVKYKKTGAEDIADALLDFDALRARVRRWSSYFDE